MLIWTHVVGWVLLVVAAACSGRGGADVCDDGLTVCGIECVDVAIDPTDCGGCGITCSDDTTCRAGRCVTACEAALLEPVSDAIGNGWDSVSREPAPYAAAADACSAIGGRLPSVTELNRVRASTFSGIAYPSDDVASWSRTSVDIDLQATVRLSDGAIESRLIGDPQAYRCVCPAPAPPYFAESRCHGPGFEPCFAVGKLNIDNVDRPPLPRGAAIAECAGEHASVLELAPALEAIQAGLVGAPDGVHIATGDRGYYNTSTAIAWRGAAWVPDPTHISNLETVTPARFRCAGYGRELVPRAVEETFQVPNGPAFDSADREPLAWADAHDACVANGGHLARSNELANAIVHGLPNGPAAYFLWTSDQTGYYAENFWAAAIRWTSPRLSYRYPDTITWHFKSDVQPFRCAYYPIDVAYPVPSACVGGCTQITVGSGPATMWFDTIDRPAALYPDAVADCMTAGGHLASERDLTEAIRGGLGNGSTAALWTSENGQTLFHVVYWNMTAPTFGDQWSIDMTWDGGDRSARAYRCMWTNELR